jgi:hypothetical protein
MLGLHTDDPEMTTGQAADQRPITSEQLVKGPLGHVPPAAPEPGELLHRVFRWQELAAELKRECFEVEIERLRLVAPAEHPRVVQDEPGCEPNVTIPHPLFGHGATCQSRPGHGRTGRREGSRLDRTPGPDYRCHTVPSHLVEAYHARPPRVKPQTRPKRKRISCKKVVDNSHARGIITHWMQRVPDQGKGWTNDLRAVDARGRPDRSEHHRRERA